MRNFLTALVCVSVMMVGSTMIFAGHNDLGPVYKGRDQTLGCMLHCDDGPCDWRIRIVDQNGNTLVNKTFYDVPNRGARAVFYSGSKKLVSCWAHPVSGDNDFSEPSAVILDNTGRTVAIMSNDRGHFEDNHNCCGTACP